MKRIAIMGCSGSGKSTLARALGQELGLPVHHLDSYYWLPGWMEPDRDEFRETLEGLYARDEWIIDGGYVGMDTNDVKFKRADLFVVFDRPVWLSIWRVLKRRLKYRNRTRPDMGPDCPEKVDLEFLMFIWNYRRDHWPRVQSRLAQYGVRVITLESDPYVPELAAKIRALSASAQTSPANPEA